MKIITCQFRYELKNIERQKILHYFTKFAALL